MYGAGGLGFGDFRCLCRNAHVIYKTHPYDDDTTYWLRLGKAIQNSENCPEFDDNVTTPWGAKPIKAVNIVSDFYPTSNSRVPK